MLDLGGGNASMGEAPVTRTIGPSPAIVPHLAEGRYREAADPPERRMIDPIRTEAVFLRWDPEVRVWSPIPTVDEVKDGRASPLTLANGSTVEIHGKLYERIWSPETTYYDDIGIPSVPIQVEFDGEPIEMQEMTGNASSEIIPFEYTGNGTFAFTLHIDKPAGAHGLALQFDGWPENGNQIYRPLTYSTVIYVNHPVEVDLQVSTSRVVVGEPVEFTGNLVDDTGTVLLDAPVQVWWEDRLLGPTDLGVYVDDVELEGANFSDDFNGGSGQWSTYSASPVDCLWEHGTPVPALGPVPHSMSGLWGTDLDGDYQLGAWSYLVSPVLDLSEGGRHFLRFWAWWRLGSDGDQCYVSVSSDYGETWDEEGSMAFTGTTLVSEGWQRLAFDMSRYSGPDHIRFAFVFRSPNRTVDTGTDGNFSYVHRVPSSSEVDRIDVRVVFPGDLAHQPAEDVASVTIVRPTRIELETTGTTGYRGQPIAIRGRLTDDRGEVLAREVRGQVLPYSVVRLWNRSGWPGDVGYMPFNWIRVDPVTGNFTGSYVISPDQPLGPVNVTVRFPGEDYYVGTQVVGVYHVKAHAYIVPSPPEGWRVRRGDTVNLTAYLRIVPEESIHDKEWGDPIPYEFVKVFWSNQFSGNRKTYHDGSFLVRYTMPTDHELGPVTVLLMFEGDSLLEPVDRKVEVTVFSDVLITMDRRTVKKGEWATISGRITDDQGEPVPFVPVYIIWKRAPEIGRQTSKADGTFSLQYYLEYEDRVGNVTVIGRFKGDSVYEEGEGSVNYTVVASTILVGRDRTLVAIQGRSVTVKAKLYEDWGGFRGTQVPRAEVVLMVGGEVLASKRTAFDGSVSFTLYLDPSIFQGGDIEVIVRFNGTEFLLGTVTRTTLFVRVDMHIEMDLEVDGRPFDRFTDVARFDDRMEGVISVHDGQGGSIEGLEISVYYVEEWNPMREYLLWTGRSDALGEFEFSTVLLGDRSGNVSFIVAIPGLSKHEYPWFTIAYLAPPPPSLEHIIETIGNTDVEVGSRLHLRVDVRYPERWQLDNITYDLVDAPDGVKVSADGVITWRPTEDQVGEHIFRVWLYDGERSETASVTIYVKDRSDFPSRSGITCATIALAAIVVAFLSKGVRRDQRPSG